MTADTTRRRRTIVSGLLALAGAWIVAAGCKGPDASRAEATGAGDASVPDAGAAAPHAAPPQAESPGSEEIRPVYPRDAGPPDPLAQRFCDAVYGLPARRAAECCGTAPGVGAGLADQCVRMLSYAMGANAIKIAPASVDACTEAMTKATVGCDWVTITKSVPIPPSCEGILEGQRREKATCRSSLECAPGLRCLGLSAIDLGVCGAPRPTGGECNLAIDTLASFTRQDHYARAHAECEGWCSARRCRPAGAEGGACKSDAACGKLRCEGGKCTSAPVPGAGEACSVECAYGLRCIGEKCATPKAEGAACEGDVECRGKCVAGDGGKGGTCGKTCTMTWPLPKAPTQASPRPKRP